MSQPNPGQLNWIANFIWTFSNRALPTSLRRRSQNQFCFLCGAELAQANGAFPRGPMIFEVPHHASSLEVALPLLQFHRSILIVIDHPVFPLRTAELSQFCDDLACGIRIRLDRARARRATERA